MGRNVGVRRLLLLCGALLALASAAVAQSDTSQILIPKRIFVGDTAELHFVFSSGLDFFADDDNVSEKHLLASTLPFKMENDDFTLRNAVIRKTGAQYSVVLTFIPWKVGLIDIPPFDLYAAVFGASAVPFMIDYAPIEVSSIMQGDDVPLKPFASPLLFPGTIYFVYAQIAVLLALLAFVVQMAIRWQKFSAKFRERRMLRRNARNARKAIRRLKKLARTSPKLSDVVFCSAIQKIFRDYLTERFGVPFGALTKNQFIPVFNTLTASAVGGFALDNFEAIVEIFTRTDYIRFARGSLEAKRLPAERFAAAFRDGEREELLATSRAVIKLFER